MLICLFVCLVSISHPRNVNFVKGETLWIDSLLVSPKPRVLMTYIMPLKVTYGRNSGWTLLTIIFNICFYLAAMGFSCGMWNLQLWHVGPTPLSGIEPGTLALRVWSLRHWTTREVPVQWPGWTTRNRMTCSFHLQLIRGFSSVWLLTNNLKYIVNEVEWKYVSSLTKDSTHIPRIGSLVLSTGPPGRSLIIGVEYHI